MKNPRYHIRIASFFCLFTQFISVLFSPINASQDYSLQNINNFDRSLTADSAITFSAQEAQALEQIKKSFLSGEISAQQSKHQALAVFNVKDEDDLSFQDLKRLKVALIFNAETGIDLSKEEGNLYKFVSYSAENNCEHLPNIFKSDAEIEAIYKDDNEKAERFDRMMEQRKGKSLINPSKKQAKLLKYDSPKTLKRLKKKSARKSNNPIPSLTFSDSDSEATLSISFETDSDDEKTLSLSDEVSESIEDDLHGFIVPDNFSDDSEEMSVEKQKTQKLLKKTTWKTSPQKKKNTPEKPLKRKKNSIITDDDYDDNFPDKIYPATKKVKITPPKTAPKALSHVNPPVTTLKGQTIVFYDTETTCITPLCGAQFVEIAALKVIDGVVRETIHCYLNPNDKKSWKGAEEAHGLGVTFLRPQTRFHKIAKTLQEFFGDDIRCAHNGFCFDDKLLNTEFTQAWIFYHFQKMLDPSRDLSQTALSGIEFDMKKINAGHAKLKEAGILKPKGNGAQQNMDQVATDLAAAAMLYFFKEHMSKSTLQDNDAENGTKAGPMMFQEGRVLPDQETHAKHYEGAASRLAWFGLIKVPTDTWAQRQKLNLPHEKPIRDAIARAEIYLQTVVDLFNSNIIDEAEFRKDKFDRKKMFDTLYYARENGDVFVRGSTITNLKLDSLLDYYGISRYDRESGNHGAGIDTSLLFQVAREMLGEPLEKGSHLWKISQESQKYQENYFFKKNSICEFNEEGKLLTSTLLHDDKIGTEFGDPTKKVANSNVPPIQRNTSFTTPVPPVQWNANNNWIYGSKIKK